MSLTSIRINLNLLALYIHRMQQSQLSSLSSANASATMSRRRKIPSLRDNALVCGYKYSQMSKPKVGRRQLRRRVIVFNWRRAAFGGHAPEQCSKCRPRLFLSNENLIRIPCRFECSQIAQFGVAFVAFGWTKI